MSEQVGRSSIPLTDEAVMANALRAAGVEIGSVGGDNFRRVVAERILSSHYFETIIQRRILASDWLAERDAEVARRAKAEALFGFTQWVASNRAYNGSEHRHGQSLYNECLSGVLHVWASEYLRGEA